MKRAAFFQRWSAACVCLCVAVLLCGFAAPSPDTPVREMIQSQAEIAAINGLIADRDFANAAPRLDEALRASPHDARLLFARARLAAGQDENARVLDLLLDAVRDGFVDFHRLDHDPLFAGFRASADYRRFVAAWATFLDERGSLDDQAARKRLGDGYIHHRHEALRLNIVAAVDQESLEDALHDLERIARFIDGELFRLEAADPRKPHPWVTVLVCNQEDFYRLVPILGVGGIYDPDQKHLVCRDIGPSLRHEFVHALHWRHMEAIGQVHPLWFQEALATLLEDLVPADSAVGVMVQPSWRTNIAKRLVRSASMTAWKRLFAMSAEHFTTRNPRANYAQVRAVADFLMSQGKLGAYYRSLVATLEEDPSGLAAFEPVFDQPIVEIERAFRLWTSKLDEVADLSWPSEAALPFRVRPGPVDGMGVDQPVPASFVTPVDKNNHQARRLLRGDVILAIDEMPVPTTDDFVRIIGKRKPGERVRLLIRRGEARFEVRVPMIPYEEFPAG